MTVAAPASPLRLHTLALLSVATLLIHGYHPFAEDGGIYVTGVKLFLQPTLYPHDTNFVTARRAYSLFDPIMGTLVRLTHLSLETVLLAAQVLCIFLTLLAVSRLAAICFSTPRASSYAAILTAAAFTLPVAGTSLFFMEPYVTARSFSTPLSLLAISFILPKANCSRTAPPLMAGAALLACAAMFHLAMAFYTAAFIVLLLSTRIGSQTLRVLVRTAMIATALVTCLAVQTHAPPEAAAAIAAAHTRTYWFLSQWQWYEWLGLVCPLVAFALALRYCRSILTQNGTDLLQTAVLAGGVACVLSMLFVRYHQHTFAVARLQPLRAFHNLYGVLIMLLGGLLAAWHGRLGRRTAWVVLAPALLAAAAMFFAQRASFPSSTQIEWPARVPRNSYTQAFLWARHNTPTNALFALDSHYITRVGEDAQNFRAIAERSMLSDYSKDGGVAAIRPALAGAWWSGSHATNNLDQLDPAARDARLRPFGVTWVVLRSTTQNPAPCPYDNEAVKVCPLN